MSDCSLGKFTDQEGFGKGKFELLSKAGTSSAPGSLHSRLPSDTHSDTPGAPARACFHLIRPHFSHVDRGGAVPRLGTEPVPPTRSVLDEQSPRPRVGEEVGVAEPGDGRGEQEAQHGHERHARVRRGRRPSCGIVVFLQFILLPLPVDTMIEIIMVVSAQILLVRVLFVSLSIGLSIVGNSPPVAWSAEKS